MLYVDHLLPQVVHALKSLEVLRLGLSVVSPNAVDLFRALPQSQLREFGFTPTDDYILEVSYSLTCLLPNIQQSLFAYLAVDIAKLRMDCSAILDLSRISLFLFVFFPS